MSCGLPQNRPCVDRRAEADEVAFVPPGCWLDVDYGAVGHGGGSYPPTIEQAYQLLEQAPEPTPAVESGHGLQAWWLLHEPYELSDDAARQCFVCVFDSLHDVVARAAFLRGWSIDCVSDLARIMRPAGKLNHKVPDDVKLVVLARDDGRRWSLEDIEKELSAEDLLEAAEPKSSTIDKANVDPESSNIPWAALNASPVARPLLAGELLDYPSASERDAAVAKVAVNFGASRNQVQSVIHHRRVVAKEKPAKARRPDYISMTYEFVRHDDGELPVRPDDRLLRWHKDVLPSLVFSERPSIAKVLTYMVHNARGVRFLGTRSTIEGELGLDPKTVGEAWKRMEARGFIKPINPHPSQGTAKGWVFLLSEPTTTRGIYSRRRE